MSAPEPKDRAYRLWLFYPKQSRYKESIHDCNKMMQDISDEYARRIISKEHAIKWMDYWLEVRRNVADLFMVENNIEIKKK